MNKKVLRFVLYRLQKKKLFLLLAICIGLLATYSVVLAGNWDKGWTDAPATGYQEWTNASTTQIKWTSYFTWSQRSVPIQDRHIELELYDPATGNFCNRLEPVSYIEVNGDWIDTVEYTNECGGWLSKNERAVVKVRKNYIIAGSSYSIKLYANKLQTLSYPGEANVSFSCWYCTSDDWLGKQSYTSSYADGGSTP